MKKAVAFALLAATSIAACTASAGSPTPAPTSKTEALLAIDSDIDSCYDLSKAVIAVDDVVAGHPGRLDREGRGLLRVMVGQHDAIADRLGCW